MIKNKYQIVRITDKNGNDRLDGRYPLRIGRKCTFLNNICLGFPLLINYTSNSGEDYGGILKTSVIQHYYIGKDELRVQTKNSIYHFKKIS